MPVERVGKPLNYMTTKTVQRYLENYLGTFTSGKMNNAHCTVCCVDTLSTGTSRSERVDAKLLWVNTDIKL